MLCSFLMFFWELSTKKNSSWFYNWVKFDHVEIFSLSAHSSSGHMVEPKSLIWWSVELAFKQALIFRGTSAVKLLLWIINHLSITYYDINLVLDIKCFTVHFPGEFRFPVAPPSLTLETAKLLVRTMLRWFLIYKRNSIPGGPTTSFLFFHDCHIRNVKIIMCVAMWIPPPPWLETFQLVRVLVGPYCV